MIIELRLAQLVSELTEVTQTYTPTQDSKIKIRTFNGTSNSNKDCIVKLIWKYGAQDQEIIWGIVGMAPMEFVYEPPQEEIDGSNQIALVLENNELTDSFLSGYSLIEET